MYVLDGRINVAADNWTSVSTKGKVLWIIFVYYIVVQVFDFKVFPVDTLCERNNYAKLPYGLHKLWLII